VEVVGRRVTDNHWHQYINPEREVDAGAYEVHGISDEFLLDKPVFADIANDFLEYIEGAELIIHNAPFDVGFLNYELEKLEGGKPTVDSICSVLDTLVMARQKHPGQKNNLDALCKRYDIDNSQRTLHGALLDARILADVYLFMTGGQTTLGLDQGESANSNEMESSNVIAAVNHGPLPVWQGDAESEKAHLEYLSFLADQCEDPAWR
ncbi:MAG: DNA polymerase III subunit epsilon, partial [Gammaproteobacteria bacterium]|nr:DNA polymerase III subunit epsilon [Gammaproteobacteria bacterium]